MFTLQILDRGQTFLHPIEGRPVLLGSGPEADVVLREAGIAAAHVRLEPVRDGVRLHALAETLLNDRPVQEALLALGDRIEIGRCVLVVGRTVARSAGPDDVLDAAGRGAQQRRRAPARRSSRLLPLLAAAGLAGVVLWVAATGGGGASAVNDELAALRHWRQTGQIERATARVDELAKRWAEATDDRLQRLAAEREALAGVEAAQARLIAAVLDPADGRGYAAWSQELQRLEHEGSPDERIAARRVRGQLAETLQQRPKPVRDRSDLAAATAEPAPVPAPTPVATTPSPAPAPIATPRTTPATTQPARNQTPANDETASVSPRAPVDLAAVDGLLAQGLFAQAINLLQAGRAAAPDPESVVTLERRIAAARTAATQALSAVLAEAEQETRFGDLRDGLQVLRAARHRFPPTTEFAALDAAIRAGEERLKLPAPPPGQSVNPARPAVADAAPPADEATRIATLGTVRAQMEAVQKAEEAGAFGVAAAGLRAAAAGVRERDPAFAVRLEARAEAADLQAAWHDAVVAALVGGRILQTTARDGQSVALRGADGPKLLGEARSLGWHEVAAVGVQALAEQVAARGPALLGAATLLYRHGDAAIAEAMLAKALRADATQKAAIDLVIARGRGEPVDASGYTLGKDGFVSARSLELEQAGKQLASRLESAMRDASARQALVDTTLAGGPESVQVLVAALRRELARQVQKLDSGSLRKQVERVARQRAVLDDARRTAKALIQDEQRYFYPYKPPAVTSDRFAEYVRVQAEVARVVDAVETAWKDTKARVNVPTSLRGDLERLDWLARMLGQFGELDHAALARIEWVRALPPGDSVGVQEYCATLAERDEFDEWRHIEAFNAVVTKDLSSAQRELLRITNAYRAMFRHRPLAIVPAICVAAQGHAEEMSKLGYFAHNSPTPERRTPYDRMRLAGYTAGVSENIALVDGALSAHLAWFGSSGHHRNLLDANHREIGIGADGRHWVQNFGSGTVHQELPAWAETAASTR